MRCQLEREYPQACINIFAEERSEGGQ
jgi:hypothetical protein